MAVVNKIWLNGAKPPLEYTVPVTGLYGCSNIVSISSVDNTHLSWQ